MTVTKINGFRAPYRSQTFQQQVGAVVSRSGVMRMDGRITQGSSGITVPPLTFVQDGLVVQKTSATAVSLPTLEAPYYLTVYSPTSANIDNLEFSFVSTPLELGSAVIVASWDGFEWRLPTMVTIDGVYSDIDKSNIDFELVGPVSGLTTALDGSNWKVSAGIVVDNKGLRQEMTTEASFPVAASDAEFKRIDRIVYRRAEDHPARVGHRDFILGSTFSDSGPTVNHLTEVFNSDAVRSNVKVVTSSDNAAHVFCASGYGTTYQLTYAKVASDRQSVLVAATDILSMTDSYFDVEIDDTDSIHVAYADGGAIKWVKLTTSGAVALGPNTISTQSSVCSRPRISVAPLADRVFFVYQSLLTVGNSQIFFASIDYGGSFATTSKNIINNASNLVNADIYVSDDLVVHLAWEDSTYRKCYFKRFNEVGGPLDLVATEVSTGTVRTGYSTLVGEAKSPRIALSDNKKIFVLFLQDKGGSVYGLSIWTDGAAYQVPLLGLSENITAFDFDVDPIFNSLGILVSRSSNLDYVRLRGESVVFTLPVLTAGVSSLALIRDRLGSLVDVWSASAAGTYTSYQTDVDVLSIGPATITGTFNNIVLEGDQLLLNATGAIPAVGDQLVISGTSTANNGTRAVTAVNAASLDAATDRYIVKVTPALVSALSPATGVKAQFLAPNGNTASFAKSTPENQASAYSLKDLESDILLARLLAPSQTVLNYNSADVDPRRFEFFLIHGAQDGVTIDWSSTQSGKLTISGQLQVVNLVSGSNYSPPAGSYAMAEGEALYLYLDETDFTPDLLTAQVIDLPWNKPIQVLGVVKEGVFVPHLLALGGIKMLNPGEIDIVGSELSVTQRNRLGLTSDTTFEAYTSTDIISLADTYPTAISKLDDKVGYFMDNDGKEEEFFGDGVKTSFTCAAITFSSSNTRYDILVWQDGRKQAQDPAGGLTKSFRKTSTNTIQFAVAPDEGVRVTIRKEGSVYGNSYPPVAGKLWSDPVDSNVTPPDLAFNLGGPTNRFQYGYVGTLHVNKLIYDATPQNISDTKIKTNGDVFAIPAGSAVSLYTDGKVYLANESVTTGQLPVGIAIETIPVGGSGTVLLFGKNVPGILSGLGFTAGFEIFISDTGTYVDSSTAFSSGAVVARVGWSDCADGSASGGASDLMMNYAKVSV